MKEIVDHFTTLVLTEDVAIPVAAMNALVLCIKKTIATTWMELEDELRSAITALKRCRHEDLGGRTNLSLDSGCDLFMKYVTRAFELDSMDFDTCKKELLFRGTEFAEMSSRSRSYISEIGNSFISDGSVVLVHGYSRVVAALVLKAAESKQFRCVVTESRPNLGGVNPILDIFKNAGIPTSLILDCAVASILSEVDLCLVGAEGVMENGSIVNRTGTYQIGIVAKQLKKPFYVAVESYKFARMYPLTQRDISSMCDFGIDEDENEEEAGGAYQRKGAKRNASITERDISDSVFGEAESIDDFSSLKIDVPQKSNENKEDLGTPGTPGTPGGLLYSNSSDNLIIHRGSNNSSRVDITQAGSPELSEKKVVIDHSMIDLTPAEYITLMFTDLGVLTPAAVSDELIRLYA